MNSPPERRPEGNAVGGCLDGCRALGAPALVVDHQSKGVCKHIQLRSRSTVKHFLPMPSLGSGISHFKVT
jgi:hypothetical protein